MQHATGHYNVLNLQKITFAIDQKGSPTTVPVDGVDPEIRRNHKVPIQGDNVQRETKSLTERNIATNRHDDQTDD